MRLHSCFCGGMEHVLIWGSRQLCVRGCWWWGWPRQKQPVPPPPHRELLFPTGSAQSSTSLPRLLQPRAPSLLLSSLHEVLGGRDKQRPRSRIIFLPFTLWPRLFFLLLCILIGTDQDRWPRLGWERPCLYPALFWSSGVLCRVEWMRSIRTDGRVPADRSPGYSFPRTWPMVLQ